MRTFGHVHFAQEILVMRPMQQCTEFGVDHELYQELDRDDRVLSRPEILAKSWHAIAIQSNLDKINVRWL